MPSLEATITAFFMSIMSFFCWTYEEYSAVLPNTLEQIAIEIKEAVPSITVTNNQETSPNINTQKDIPTAPTQKPLPNPKETPKIVEPIIPKETSTTPKPSLPKTELPATRNSSNKVEDKIKSSVGNLFCTTIKGNKIEKRTGSVVAISNTGVMITNAHVAEHLLLSNTSQNISQTCFVRTGSPALKAYSAKVLFMPDEWVYANKDNLKYQSLSGTGEHDYALIVLTEKVNQTSPSLSFLNPKGQTLSPDKKIFASGYPVFGASILDNALYNRTESLYITKTWGLGKTNTDLADTSATVIATVGSSGGAITDTEGNLIGIIVASSVDQSLNKPSIRLISLDYIEKDIKEKTGKTLSSFFNNPEELANRFIETEGTRLAQILRSNSN